MSDTADGVFVLFDSIATSQQYQQSPQKDRSHSTEPLLHVISAPRRERANRMIFIGPVRDSLEGHDDLFIQYITEYQETNGFDHFEGAPPVRLLAGRSGHLHHSQ